MEAFGPPQGLFVYGTLMRKFEFTFLYCRRFLEGCKVRTGRAHGVVLRQINGLWTLVPSTEPDAWVDGEYVEPGPLLMDLKLRQADFIEGDAYERIVVDVSLSCGPQLRAYAYRLRDLTQT